MKEKIRFEKIAKMTVTEGTTKLRNENETKRNEMKRNEMKRNETKYNKTKRKMKKRNETK